MAHPRIDNETAFVLETLFLADERGVPLCVPVVKATFNIGPDGELAVAPEQLPVDVAGTPYADPESSSYMYEPETAFFKPATDVVLIGHAYGSSPDTTEVLTGIRVGPAQKLVRVIGDRFLVKRSGQVHISSPTSFERMPLTYERAFGGWDRRSPDPGQHQVEMRNPVGTGFRSAPLDTDDEIRMPNLEDPSAPFEAYGDRPAPAGFGFVSPHWMPRSRFAGTYDEDWSKNRSPLLPNDFDRRFFNAASPGLIAKGYLRGDEPVVVVNASPEGRLAFSLPGVAPPVCEYRLRTRKEDRVSTNLDTVIVNTDTRQLILLWRTYISLRVGPHDLAAVRMRIESESYARV